jgi:hypothetical protein
MCACVFVCVYLRSSVVQEDVRESTCNVSPRGAIICRVSATAAPFSVLACVTDRERGREREGGGGERERERESMGKIHFQGEREEREREREYVKNPTDKWSHTRERIRYTTKHIRA